MKRIDFLSLDTLFFRDGSPFNANELQSGALTCFPPSPPTLVGAVRAAVAPGLGWNGSDRNSNWDSCCLSQLGSGPDLGPLKFRGPFLSCDAQPVFPVPAHILGASPKQTDEESEDACRPANMVCLRPSDTIRHCDLGSVRLAEAPRDRVQGRKLLHPTWWMNAAGMKSVLEGDIPEPKDLLHASELWSAEQRVGISRNPATRTTQDQALYAPRHIRPAARVCLSMYVEGLERPAVEGLSKPHVQAVGGESRGCWLDITDAELPLPALPQLSTADGKLRYAVFVLTPLRTTEPPQANQSFCDLPGTIVSACLPRPQFWGGWDSVNNQPSALKPHLAPGSVLFLEVAADQAADLAKWHGASIGIDCAWGFGVIALGTWPT